MSSPVNTPDIDWKFTAEARMQVIIELRDALEELLSWAGVGSGFEGVQRAMARARAALRSEEQK